MASAPALREGAPFPRTAVGSTLWGKALEFATQILLVAAVPRVLGPADYGVFALALTVLIVTSWSIALGGPALLSRFIPAVAPSEREALARVLMIRMARWRGAVLGAIVICAIALVAAAPSTFPPVLVALAVTALVLDAGASLAFQAALAFGGTTAWNFRFGVQNLILVASALVGHGIAGVEGAVAGLAISSGAAFAWSAVYVVPPLLRTRGGASLPAGALGFGALQAVGSFLDLVTTRGAVVAVAILAGSSAETGFAAIAVGIAMAGTYVIWQLFTVQLPDLVAATREEPDPSLAERSLGHLGYLSLAGALAVAIAGVCLIQLVVPVVFGDEFEGAEAAAAVALAALPLAPVTGIATQAAALRLRLWLRVRAAAAGTVVFALTAVFAIPHWGATGGSVALLSGTAVSAIVSRLAFPEAIDRRLLAGALAGSGLLLGLAAATGTL